MLIQNAPLVTVYTPAYNHQDYIRQAIESVIRQTYQEWELFVINDGSQDETEKALQLYQNHPRITIVHQANQGLTKTNNLALRMARGKYIVRLDGDDFFDENALLVMVTHLENRPDIGLVYPDYYTVDQAGNLLSTERRKKVGKEVELLDLPAHGACTMFRTDCLKKVGGYNEDIRCQDGYDLWIRFVEHYAVDNINLPLFYYRQHENNLTGDRKRILETRQKIKRSYAEVKEKREKGLLRRLGVIPVRGHSQIKYELALENLGGRPLIDHTLQPALETGVFEKLVVVSENDHILQHVKKNYPHVEAVARPERLARRNVPILETLTYVMGHLEEKQEAYEEMMVLYVDCPMRRKEHIIQAFDTMLLFETDSVVSVCETLKTYYKHGRFGLERIGSQEDLMLEREALYEGNGAILLLKTANLRDDRPSLFGKKVGHITMLPEESLTLYSSLEWDWADFLIRQRHTFV